MMIQRVRRRNSLRFNPLIVFSLVFVFCGCTLKRPIQRPVEVFPAPTALPTTEQPPVESQPLTRPVEPKAPPAQPGKFLARNNEFVITTVEKGDTLHSLAEKFLGSSDEYWKIFDFNGIAEPIPGDAIVIPLVSQNSIGVYPDGIRTVPILCYHQFGDRKAKMVVSVEKFEEQMAFLRDNGYRVVPMSGLRKFLDGRESLPNKSVIITIDDGYKSIYDKAYPILRKYSIPATIFIYTDFLNAKRGLSWEEMKEMTDSGLIDIQSHSKSHSNMGILKLGESLDDYRRRISEELEYPKSRITENLDLPVHTFAYPYGDANEEVVKMVPESNYLMGVTVQPGGNAFYGDPFLLKRTMVFGDDDLEAFVEKLEVFKNVPPS